MQSSRSVSPRARSAETTKQAMLTAARRRFLRESYENVGLRDVAGDVSVDVALVGRYFGSKEELFRQVLLVGRQEEILPPEITVEEVPAFLAQLFLAGTADADQNVERLLIILRSASSPAASQVVQETLGEDVLTPLAARLGGANPELRASMIMAVWMGMTIMRTVIEVEPVREQTSEMKARLEALFRAALS
jgi:AcrR family transcriptional regulator